MNHYSIIFIVLGYFVVLFLISLITSKGASKDAFFTGDKESPWYLVAFGMIGTSLSGVTFISLPGLVATSQFSYMQVVFGYFFGYLIVRKVLLPLYYSLPSVSIYSYLEDRFGSYSYKTGAACFLLSRAVGAAFRLFLVAGVFQLFIFDYFDIPFWVSVLATITLIWIYTFRSGIKTIVWTDTLQTFFMVLAVALSIYYISDDLGWSFGEMVLQVKQSSYSQIFFFTPDKSNFFIQVLSGAFITIVMTGLDQDMMQKNLSIKTLAESQKNMKWFSIILIPVNLMFLALGALLYLYANQNGIDIPTRTDDLYPMLAVDHFSPFISILFILGLIAAAYSSADSALTALTTSVCIDFLGGEKKEVKTNTRRMIHILVSFVLFGLILFFNGLNDKSVITNLFTAAGYTYGPLLGLFIAGRYTKIKVHDKWVPLVCLVSPILSILLYNVSPVFLGYSFGFEIGIVNAAITIGGLYLIRRNEN